MKPWLPRLLLLACAWSLARPVPAAGAPQCPKYPKRELKCDDSKDWCQEKKKAINDSYEKQKAACQSYEAARQRAQAQLASCQGQNRYQACQAAYARALKEAAEAARKEMNSAREILRAAREKAIQRLEQRAAELARSGIPGDDEKARRLQAIADKLKKKNSDPRNRLSDDEVSDITGSNDPELQGMGETINDSADAARDNDTQEGEYANDRDRFAANEQAASGREAGLDTPSASDPGGSDSTANNGGQNGGSPGANSGSQGGGGPGGEQQAQQGGGGDGGGGSPQGQQQKSPSTVSDAADAFDPTSPTPKGSVSGDDGTTPPADPVKLAAAAAPADGITSIDPGTTKAAASLPVAAAPPATTASKPGEAVRLDPSRVEGGNALREALAARLTGGTGGASSLGGGSPATAPVVPDEAQGAAARSLGSSGYSYSGAGSGGGSSGPPAAEEVLSPFAPKPLGDPKVLLANSETDAAVHRMVSEFSEREEEGMEAEEDGVGSKHGPSLFERTHQTHEVSLRRGKVRGLAYR